MVIYTHPRKMGQFGNQALKKNLILLGIRQLLKF